MLARMRRNIVIEKSLRVVLAPSSDSQAEDKIGQQEKKAESESEREKQKEKRGMIVVLKTVWA